MSVGPWVADRPALEYRWGMSKRRAGHRVSSAMAREDELRVLDGHEDDPNEIEIEWADTIERRARELREGVVQAVPSEEVFAAADAILREG